MSELRKQQAARYQELNRWLANGGPLNNVAIASGGGGAASRGGGNGPATNAGMSILSGALDFISRPLYGSMNFAAEAPERARSAASKSLEKTKKRQEDFTAMDKLLATAKGVYAGATGKAPTATNALGTLASPSPLIDVFSSKDYREGLLATGDSDKKKLGVDLIDKVIDEAGGSKPTWKSNKSGTVARGVGGFALDVALDPVSYIPLAGFAAMVPKGIRASKAIGDASRAASKATTATEKLLAAEGTDLSKAGVNRLVKNATQAAKKAKTASVKASTSPSTRKTSAPLSEAQAAAQTASDSAYTAVQSILLRRVASERGAGIAKRVAESAGLNPALAKNTTTPNAAASTMSAAAERQAAKIDKLRTGTAPMRSEAVSAARAGVDSAKQESARSLEATRLGVLDELIMGDGPAAELAKAGSAEIPGAPSALAAAVSDPLAEGSSKVIMDFADSVVGAEFLDWAANLRHGITSSRSDEAAAKLLAAQEEAATELLSKPSSARDALFSVLGSDTTEWLKKVPKEQRAGALEALRRFADDPDALTPGELREMPLVAQRFLEREFADSVEAMDAMARASAVGKTERALVEDSANVLSKSSKNDPIALSVIAKSIGVSVKELTNDGMTVLRKLVGDGFNPSQVERAIDGTMKYTKANGRTYGVIDGSLNEYAMTAAMGGFIRRIGDSLGSRVRDFSARIQANRFGVDGAPGFQRSWEEIEKAYFESGMLPGVRVGNGVEFPLSPSSIYAAGEKWAAAGGDVAVLERLLYNGSTSIRSSSLMKAASLAALGRSDADIVKALHAGGKSSVRGSNGNPLTSDGLYGIVDKAGPAEEGVRYVPRKKGGFTVVYSGERLTQEALDFVKTIAPSVLDDSVLTYATHVQKSVQDASKMLFQLEEPLRQAMAKSEGAGIAELGKVQGKLADMAAELGASRMSVHTVTQRLNERLPTGAVLEATRMNQVSERVLELATSGASPEQIAQRMEKMDAIHLTRQHAKKDYEELADAAARAAGEEAAEMAGPAHQAAGAELLESFFDEIGHEFRDLLGKSGLTPEYATKVVAAADAWSIGQPSAETFKKLGSFLYRGNADLGKVIPDASQRYKFVGGIFKALDKINGYEWGAKGARVSTEPSVGKYAVGTETDQIAARAETFTARLLDFFGEKFNVKHNSTVDGVNIHEIMRQGFGISGRDINITQQALYDLHQKFNVAVPDFNDVVGLTGKQSATVLDMAFWQLQGGKRGGQVDVFLKGDSTSAEAIQSAVEGLRPVVAKFFDLDDAGTAGDFFFRYSSNQRYMRDALSHYGLRKALKNPFPSKVDPSRAWRDWDIQNPADFLNRYNLAAHRALDSKKTGMDLADKLLETGLASRVAKPGYLKPEQAGRSYMAPGLEDSGLFFDARALDAVSEMDIKLAASRDFGGAFGKAVTDVFDPAQQVWKTTVTIYRLGHHARNLTSNAGISFLAEGGRNLAKSGVISAKLLARNTGSKSVGPDGALPMSEIQKMLSGDPMQLGKGGSDIAFTSGKGKGAISVTYDELYEEAARRGALRTFMQAEDLIKAREGSLGSKLADKLTLTHTKLGRAVGRGSEAMDHHSYIQQAIQHFMNNAHSVGAGKKFPTKKALWDASYERSARFHPDSTQMSPFEAKVMRRLIPFYTWFRGTLPSIMSASWHSPGRAAAFHKASYGAAQAMGIDAESYANPFPADADVPDFLRERVFGANFRSPFSGDMFALNPGFAHVDLASDFFGRGPRVDPETGERTQSVAGNLVENVVRYLFANATPGIKLPLDLLTMTDLSSGKPIKDVSEHIDKTIPNFDYLGGLLGISPSGTIAKGRPDPKKAVEWGLQTGLFDESGSFSPGETQATKLFNWLSGQGAVKVPTQAQSDEAKASRDAAYQGQMIDSGEWEDYDSYQGYQGYFGYHPYRSDEQKAWAEKLGEQGFNNDPYPQTYEPYPMTDSQLRSVQRLMPGWTPPSLN